MVPFKLRRVAGIMAALTIGVAGVLTASAATATASQAAVTKSQPGFNFCNNTGPNNSPIACFQASITFHNADSFTLSNIKLEDKACDQRSVFALVAWQNGFVQNGVIDGLPYTYENAGGCGTTLDLGSQSYSSSGGVTFVQIALFAANVNGHSTVVPSRKRINPF